MGATKTEEERRAGLEEKNEEEEEAKRMHVAKVVDTIVVGAGIAGLMTALTLRDAGKEVCILEAGEKAGGRLRTTSEGVDLGAAWSWESDREVRGLAKRLGVETMAQPSRGECVLDSSRGRRTQADSGAAGPGAVRFRGGFGSLIEKLAAELEITTNMCVKSVIAGEKEGVEITTAKGETYKARTAVITAPPRVASQLEYTPKLKPSKYEVMAVTQTWMGDASKVCLFYDRPWWRENGYSGAVFSDAGPLSQIWDNSDDQSGVYALCGFAFGALAKTLNDVTEERCRVLVGRQIARAFFLKTPPEATSLKRVLWANEATIQLPPPKGYDNIRPYGHPKLSEPHHAVFFAGTETDPEHGHVEGALRSAATVSTQVLDFLQKRDLEIDLESKRVIPPWELHVCDRHKGSIAADNAQASMKSAYERGYFPPGYIPRDDAFSPTTIPDPSSSSSDVAPTQHLPLPPSTTDL